MYIFTNIFMYIHIYVYSFFLIFVKYVNIKNFKDLFNQYLKIYRYLENMF